jgi:hypothetical protein
MALALQITDVANRGEEPSTVAVQWVISPEFGLSQVLCKNKL